ncbi:hypothetical protein C8J57DRAFT_1230695 [Mycena rebaudengoi]|nr:hypothetical protein C8J57DRAFT_1230695 [Mycena rebaudengoi]
MRRAPSDISTSKDGTEILAEATGDYSKPHIVFVRGFTGTGATFDPIFKLDVLTENIRGFNGEAYDASMGVVVGPGGREYVAREWNGIGNVKRNDENRQKRDELKKNHRLGFPSLGSSCTGESLPLRGWWMMWKRDVSAPAPSSASPSDFPASAFAGGRGDGDLRSVERPRRVDAEADVFACAGGSMGRLLAFFPGVEEETGVDLGLDLDSSKQTQKGKRRRRGRGTRGRLRLQRWGP